MSVPLQTIQGEYVARRKSFGSDQTIQYFCTHHRVSSCSFVNRVLVILSKLRKKYLTLILDFMT